MAKLKHGFRYAVALTEIGKAELTMFSSKFVDDGIFNCEMVDVDGPFVELTIRSDLPPLFGKEYEEMSLMIPHAYVSYIFSYPPERKPGFYQNVRPSLDTAKDQHHSQ